MKADKMENVIKYLESLGIECSNVQDLEKNFNRVIEFKIEERIYHIEWWVNQSYFKLVNEFSSPMMPFKYINVNDCSPTSKHALQLCFYDVKSEKGNQFIYNEIPFGAFKIPFNK